MTMCPYGHIAISWHSDMVWYCAERQLERQFTGQLSWIVIKTTFGVSYVEMGMFLGGEENGSRNLLKPIGLKFIKPTNGVGNSSTPVQ